MPNRDARHLSDTWDFFKTMKKALIDDIPMRTFPKHRYSTGTSLEFLRGNEVPERKDWFTLNAPRLTNVASQMVRDGFFSVEEEKAIIQAEKFTMIRPNEAPVVDVPSFEKDVAPLLGHEVDDSEDGDSYQVDYRLIFSD